jgi:hypothetical protein
MSSVITPLFGAPAPGCYVVDAATSGAVLLGSARTSIAVRPLRVRACVTGRVTIGVGGQVLDASFLLTPEPGLRLRRGPAWRRGPTCVTTVRTYRISSCQYRIQIEFTWAKLAASAVLSLWTRAPQPGDRPHTLRLRALTVGRPFEAHRCDDAAVPRVWMRLILNRDQ